MRNNEIKGIIFMLAASLIWSFSTVMIKTAVDDLGPWTFTAIRCLLGGLSMIPLVIIFDLKGSVKNVDLSSLLPKSALRDCLLLGGVVAAYMMLIQVGIAFTTIGKCGFITALYIIIVPIMGIFLKKMPSLRIWLCVIIAVIGFYLMCMSEGLSAINKGDVLIFIGAFFCAMQIYFIDSLSKRISPMLLTCLQFLFAGIICMVGAFVVEHPTVTEILTAIVPLLYTGVVSCGIGYMLQAYSQKYVEPMKASLLFSSETIFTMIFGLIIFQEIMSFREYVGCGLIFFAIVYSIIEPKEKGNEI